MSKLKTVSLLGAGAVLGAVGIMFLSAPNYEASTAFAAQDEHRTIDAGFVDGHVYRIERPIMLPGNAYGKSGASWHEACRTEDQCLYRLDARHSFCIDRHAPVARCEPGT